MAAHRNSPTVCYVLQVDPETHGETVRDGSILTPEGTTLAGALRQIAWQTNDGSDPRRFVIARPDPDLPGVMFQLKPVGKRCVVLVHKGPFTEAAHAEHLTAIWGA